MDVIAKAQTINLSDETQAMEWSLGQLLEHWDIQHILSDDVQLLTQLRKLCKNS